MEKYHNKYHVVKAETGIPVAFPTFVLRLDGQDLASLKALHTYADCIKDCNPELYNDLITIYRLATNEMNTITKENLKLALR